MLKPNTDWFNINLSFTYNARVCIVVIDSEKLIIISYDSRVQMRIK